MCGICGKSSPAGVSQEELQRMASSIAHRGPDDEGFYRHGPIGLASRRLSIIDVKGGHQPIANEDGSAWIVFNGEIYNYRSLRAGLEARGHRFSTRSDTEVIVHLYEEEGDRCVRKLQGMFAFAIWDQGARKLLLARDRLGQKPLFYLHRGDELLFASEVKAILAADPSLAELDAESLHHYLSLRFVPPPRTMFRRIRKLPAAHTLVFQNGSLEIHRYWQLSFREKLRLPEAELLAGLEERLERAVGSHLVSDVPVGVLLSGGMDSSMIVALMSKALPNGFKSFSIGVEDASFDELPFARRVASQCGTSHEEEIVSVGLVARLPETIRYLDEPSDPIATCMNQAAALAARHVKVTLGGDGGDELFAGFDRYLGVQRLQRFSQVIGLVPWPLALRLLSLLPESFAYKSWTQRLRWLARLGAFENAAERYAEATVFFRFSHQQKKRLFAGDLWAALEGARSTEVLTTPFEAAPATDLLDRMLFTDYLTRLPEHSLMLTDRMGMAHGLEIRSPLLDHELVEYLAKVPSDLKIRDGTLKYALRKVAEGILPQEIVQRGKQGFMFPTARWLREDLGRQLDRFLLGGRAVGSGIFDRIFVEDLLAEHRRSRIDHSVRLWMLLSFEIWYRMYLEGRAPDDLARELEISPRRELAAGG